MSKKKKIPAGIIVIRILLVLLTTILAIALALGVILAVIEKGPSPSARNTFVSTVLESGNLKFLAGIFLSEDEINEIVANASMGQKIDASVDSGLIHIGGEVEGNFDENGVERIEIQKANFNATLLVIKNPAQVQIASTYPWSDKGLNLDVLVKNAGALGGVNGGLYDNSINWGPHPWGVCVSKGFIQYNDLSNNYFDGLVMIGFDENDILRIEDIDGWTSEQFEEYVAKEKIRDAIAFQEEYSDSNNHFVSLIINGEKRQMSGLGSGQNPRTAIGQRADGAVLLLVTDGRWYAGHPGATAYDLINIMDKYGAVNAANIDGGSSSCMYYKDWIRHSVTLHSINSSWLLPTAFVIMGEEK